MDDPKLLEIANILHSMTHRSGEIANSLPSTTHHSGEIVKFLLPTVKHCEIVKSEEDFKQTHLTSAQEVTWTARDLNDHREDPSYSFDSPPFVFEKATWCLRLYPNSSYKGFAFIGLTIVRLCSCVPHHRLQYHLKSLDGDKNVSIKTADFDEKYIEKGDMTFIARYEENSQKPRGVIRVACRVSLYGSHVEDASSQTKLSGRDIKEDRTLGENLKNLLLNGQDHDVVLKVMDKGFRAHQNILRARSPVLESMLSHDMIEKNSGTIDIPNCNPSAFEQFLIYLYSGKVDTLDAGNMLSLYYIADKYDVGHLKEECLYFIKESLSSSNITYVIETALDHSDADLLRWATEYFVKEMNEILPTVEWMLFMKRNAVQANELIMKATKKMRPI